MEILTLQFGHYSNFIGTHWWNIQESDFNYNLQESSEIDHDILFREGLTSKGEVTFTPRLLLVDLKGSLKSLREDGELYEATDSKVNWGENLISVIEEEKIKKNEFLEDLNATNTVKENYDFDKIDTVWSDYLYTRYHPRTVNVLKEFQHNDTKRSFDVYPSGTALWKTRQFEDFQDKIRNYIEECDNSQGFQIISDSIDGFSGLSSSCLEYLNDEYGSKSILSFPVIPSYFEDNPVKVPLRLINLVLCYQSLLTYSSLFVPLSLGSKAWREAGPERQFYRTNYNVMFELTGYEIDYCQLLLFFTFLLLPLTKNRSQKNNKAKNLSHKASKNFLPYHTSAILASALDTFTLSYRLKSKLYSLSDLQMDLGFSGRKALAASLCLPFSINCNQDFIDCLNNWEGPLSKSITPSYEVDEKNVSQLITLRGISEYRLNQVKSKKNIPADNCNSVKEILSSYIACNSYASSTNVFTVSKPLCTKRPYPNKIFDLNVGKYGNIESCSKPNIVVEDVPVLAGLHNGANVGYMLESLINETKRIKFNRVHQFKDGGIENDEFVECLNQLMQLSEVYQDNYFL